MAQAAVTERFAVKVWFATAREPRVIAVYLDHEAALREARAYLNADARGVWINDEPVLGRKS